MDDASAIAQHRLLRMIEWSRTRRRLKPRGRCGILASIGGSVAAGVIGTMSFVYDVLGETANVVSRLEAASLPGRIRPLRRPRVDAAAS